MHILSLDSYLFNVGLSYTTYIYVLITTDYIELNPIELLQSLSTRCCKSQIFRTVRGWLYTSKPSRDGLYDSTRIAFCSQHLWLQDAKSRLDLLYSHIVSLPSTRVICSSLFRHLFRRRQCPFGTF
jgi:hypothetical protein